MLKTRILTALVLAPTVLVLDLYAPVWLFKLAVAALLLTGTWEFRKLANLGPGAGVALLLVQILIMGLVVMNWSLLVQHAYWCLLAICTAWLVLFTRLYRFDADRDTGSAYQAIGFLSALIAISGSFFAILWLREQTSGEFLIVMMLFIIWAADVGAYFSGRFLGRTPLAPRISPKKTWEGVLGGIVLATLAAVLFSKLTPLSGESIGSLVLLTIITVMSSIGGDLFISVHKRCVKLKDAGNLFPGHGGVLDRFDSMLPGSAFFALAVWVLIQ